MLWAYPALLRRDLAGVANSMQSKRTWLGIYIAALMTAACGSNGGSSGASAGGSSSGGGSPSAAVGGAAGSSCVPSGTAGAMSATASAGGGAEGTSDGSGGGSGGAASAGTSGSAGSAGGGAALGPNVPVPSAGCGKPAPETPAQFVKHSLMSSGVSRDFFAYLPTGYDSKKPYPTIFAFEPCGGSGNPSTNVPIQNESKNRAIIISPQAKGNCYENQIRNSPDVTLFDDTLKYAEANYCVDQSRVFAMGYSAGSWMSIILGCERANVVRAHAQVSGGLPMFIRPGADCTGNMPALLIHDATDPTNTINGGIAARDRLLRVDRCGASTEPWGPTPCVAYRGCKVGFPVVWCETTGNGHGRQDNLAPAAIWQFFSQF